MLHLHRAERADRLADALADVLRTPLPDAFAREVVAVPAKGVERWLTQRLSHVLGAAGRGDGACAGVDFPSTAGLLAAATDRAADPWDTERLVWPLLEVIDANLDQPWSTLLAHYLGRQDVGGDDVGGDDVGGGHVGGGHVGAGAAPDHRLGRRWATAAHLAGLFAGYGADRPQMLRDWALGRDTAGDRAPLPADVAWQAQLWRGLRAVLGPSPAERLPELCRRLRTDPGASDLPARVSLFGPTRLSTEQREVLAALAVHREVHLWLAHPSSGLWASIAAAQVSRPALPGRRRDDPTADAARHPLLASLGRDARELQVVLEAMAVPVVDTCEPARELPATLLGRLQADIGADRAPDGRHALAEADRSVQVHSCHGPVRQVEVLREVLLRLFADDPTLEPRDVLVMCPDIETYAPLVSANFGLDGGEHPGHRLRVRLADRSLRRTNPLLDVVARLLDLAAGRVTAGQVLDLAAAAPVRRRFDLDDDDLERLRGWVAATGTRWGLDRGHRARAGLDLPQGTWRTGLDRLLLGVAASEDGLNSLGLALPLDDVDSSDADLAGRFAELVERLQETLDELREQPAQAWADALSRGLELLTAVAEPDTWQVGQTRSELARATAGSPVRIGLADAQAMLAERLRGRPTRANFRTGRLTVCTMVPMRSVPHRVVVLLGLDDGSYPRVAAVDGDDVVLRDPRVGERDRRSEDRQLLLDALLAAGDTVVLTYTGADPVTGETRPPAVPVGELLDVLEATCAPPSPGGPAVRDRLTRRHPLQPFDRRDFEGVPFSFDRIGLRGVQRASGDRQAPAAFLAGPLPERGGGAGGDGRSSAGPGGGGRGGDGEIDLADLVAFLEHPVRAFLRQRLGVGVPGDADDVEDALPIVLDGLQRWDIGERMLGELLGGGDPTRFAAAEWRRGTLPPGPLGAATLSEIGREVSSLVADSPRPGPARTLDVRVDLGGGRALVGTVTGVHGRLITRSTFSRLGAAHRLRAWAQLLATGAAYPQQPWQAVVTARRAGSTLTLPPDPLSVLRSLVELRAVGLREPLPIATKTSAAYALARHSGRSVAQALSAAEREWTGDLGDQRDANHGLVWGERVGLEVLLAEPGVAEPTRFGELARALWDPLLRAALSGPGA